MTGRSGSASRRAGAPSGLSRDASQAQPLIPNAERRQIVAFLAWWSMDQARLAETTLDFAEEIEFSIRSKALADAARDILDFGDVRHAQAIEAAKAAETATEIGGSVHESAVAASDAPNTITPSNGDEE